MPTPNYLTGYQISPSWMVKPEERKSLRFRCERLAGLTNLYFWSLTWAVHRARNWKLGMPPVEYYFGRPILWLLGVETVEDVVEAGWKTIAESVRVERRKEDVVGSFNPRNIRDHGVHTEYAVQPETWSCVGRPDDKPSSPPTFFGHDRLASVTFHDRVNCVPWMTIENCLRDAYVNAERHLKAEHIRWNGPPRFRELQNGMELLTDPKTKKLDREELLGSIEKARRKKIREIETVIRGDVQRRQAAETKKQRRKPTAKFEPKESGKPPRGMKIPVSERTRQMTLSEAARLLGYPQKNRAKILSRSIQDGEVIADAVNRQSYYFRRDAFDKSLLPKIVPHVTSASPTQANSV